MRGQGPLPLPQQWAKLGALAALLRDNHTALSAGVPPGRAGHPREALSPHRGSRDSSAGGHLTMCCPAVKALNRTRAPCRMCEGHAGVRQAAQASLLVLPEVAALWCGGPPRTQVRRYSSALYLSSPSSQTSKPTKLMVLSTSRALSFPQSLHVNAFIPATILWQQVATDRVSGLSVTVTGSFCLTPLYSVIPFIYSCHIDNSEVIFLCFCGSYLGREKAESQIHFRSQKWQW